MRLPYLGLLLWFSSSLAWQAWLSSERSMIMRWPLYLPELFVPLGVALLLAQVVIEIGRTLAAIAGRGRG